MDYREYDFDETRLQNREELLDDGWELYPYNFDDNDKIDQVISDWSSRDKEKEDELYCKIAGRVWAIRDMGGTIFWDVKDNSGKIQCYLTKDNFEEDIWRELDRLDRGDFVGVEGEVFKTNKGELTINVHNLKVLAKSVVSIPVGKETDEENYYQLSDEESKYRERYLHWMLHDDGREKIKMRSRIIRNIRDKMDELGFLEVDTPTIEMVYGGAEARPFETEVWAMDRQKAYLRISPELSLKKYIVGGFDKVFTVCKNFRNEGIDKSHNPEFTMMEWYEAYTDYQDQMKQFEDIVAYVCEKVHGTTSIEYQGTTLDFSTPWKRITMIGALKKYGEINVNDSSVSELKELLEDYEIEYTEPLSWGVAVAELFEEICEDKLIQPTFVMDYPIDISPLTKKKRGDKEMVERFEPFICGMEVGNSYSELTDPVDQLKRFLEHENIEADKEEFEEHPIDPDFIKAIGCGMPPTGGVGLGIDRIIMILTNAESIRDIIPFPLMKPKGMN